MSGSSSSSHNGTRAERSPSDPDELPPAPPGLGSLFLIPNLLGENAHVESSLTPVVYTTIRALAHFIVEEEKSARHLIKRADPERHIRELSIERLNEHTDPTQLDRLVAPLSAGHSIGVISEAGCPAIADPGAAIVSRAHRLGARVHPLVGPCSMVLALMASGFNGQRWRFSGYPPREEPARRHALRALENDLYAHAETQILMEPPYRNQKLLSDLTAICRPETTLCVALGLTTPAEAIYVHTIKEWRAHPRELPRIPAVFLLGRFE